jgi:hypothetical protein
VFAQSHDTTGSSACACGGVLYAAGVHRVLAGLTALYLLVGYMGLSLVQLLAQMQKQPLEPAPKLLLQLEVDSSLLELPVVAVQTVVAQKKLAR